jgi:broad specificity phosphatase PhoE
MRHAPTAWNRDGRVMGRVDVPIDELGRNEAEAAAGSSDLRRMGIDALFCSPMVRCIQTAQFFEHALNTNFQVVPGLEERGWGPFEGQPKEERDQGTAVSGVEELSVFRARTLSALSWVAEQANSPLVVTHSGVIRVALLDCGRVPIERIPHLVPFEVTWPQSNLGS